MITIPIWLFVVLCLPIGISLIMFLIFAVSETITKIIDKHERKEYGTKKDK